MINQDLLKFIKESPSTFHVVENLKKLFALSGYVELPENEHWSISEGGKYFTVRNDSSIIAFSLPNTDAKGFHIVASHSDSPGFLVKENPEMKVENKYIKLNTEKYGGSILSTWMDRPLSVAGRIIVEKDGELSSRLVNLDRDLCVIPNLAIHMNRDVNKGVELNSQIDMLPLFSTVNGESDKKLLELIAEEENVKCTDILGSDLYLYVRDSGRILGANEELICSPKLDDLQCAYTSAVAMTKSLSDSFINVVAIFDNEEVGSATMQGADSSFLRDAVDRICQDYGINDEQKKIMLNNSFLISADNAHGVHPNHPEKCDPTNRPVINGGIVLKHSAARKYTTDGMSAAYLRNLCKKAQIPCQDFFNKSDMAGGSTLGNISTSQLSIASADIGLSQLAMHSAYETAGGEDTRYALKLFETFFAL